MSKYFYSKTSSSRLITCCPELQDIFYFIILEYDVSIVDGHRGEERHNLYLKEGVTKVKFGESKHNIYPSDAVDVVPYFAEKPHVRYDEEHLKYFYYLAGGVFFTARKLGVLIRWGGDWNRNNNFDDEDFYDLQHFEIIR